MTLAHFEVAINDKSSLCYDINFLCGFVFMNSLKLLSSVAIITLSVTGCLGNKQPARHNQVVGEKRAPALNVQTAQPDVPFPTDEMLYATPPEPKVGLQPRTNWDEPSKSQQNMAGVNPSSANAAQINVDNGAIQPSPLYYYEQQQAKVQASDLSANNAPNEIAPATGAVAALPPSPLAIQEATAAPVAQPIIEKTVAKMAEVQFEPEQVEIKEEYPRLNDVPNPQQLQEVGRFKQAKEDAQDFTAEQKQGEAAIPKEPEFQELTLDEFMAKEAVDEVAKENAQPVVEAQMPTSTQNIDFSKQPLPEVPMNEAETIMQPSPLMQTQVPASAAPAVATKIEPSQIEPFADANSKQEIKQEMEAQVPMIATPSAEPQVVAVPDAEPVAATPRNQRLYTSGGVIELTPPTSISSRGRELPPSRYQYRRQLTH
jgi:hypothetical protein